MRTATLQRICRAEAVLFDWACETITIRTAQARLRSLGFSVDFIAEPWSHKMRALDLVTGKTVTLEI